MGKRIIVLNRSPRWKGNTSALVMAFTERVEEAGNTITKFFLHGMNIHEYMGCFGSEKDPEHPCVQHDGMDETYPAYRTADVVVLASPLYYRKLSRQLSTTFNGLFAVAECDPSRRPEKGVYPPHGC